MANSKKPVDRKQGVFTEWRARRKGPAPDPWGLACASGLMFQCTKKSTISIVQKAFTVCLKLFLRTLLPTARSVTRKPGALN